MLPMASDEFRGHAEPPWPFLGYMFDENAPGGNQIFIRI